MKLVGIHIDRRRAAAVQVYSNKRLQIKVSVVKFQYLHAYARLLKTLHLYTFYNIILTTATQCK